MMLNKESTQLMIRKHFAAPIILTVSTTTINILAGIARPNPEKEGKFVIHSGFEIVPDQKGYEARLEIPQAMWKEMHAGLTEIPVNPTLAQRIAHSLPSTIVAGIFLFLSFSF